MLINAYFPNIDLESVAEVGEEDASDWEPDNRTMIDLYLNGY